MGGTMLTTRWEIDDNWFAVGLSTDEPDNFSGFHAAHLLVIVDEASGVGDEIYEAIDGVMAGGNAKLLMIGNPTRLTGYFAKAFKDPDVQKMHISGFDTPNVAAGEVIVPGLMKPEYPGQMERKYGKNSDIYRIKVEGKFGKKETDTLISVDQVEAAIQREVKPEGKKRMAVDVARFGDDKSIILVRQGHKVRILEEIAYGDTMELAGKIKHWAKVEEIPAEEIDVDVVGVGGGVVDRLHEQGFDVNGVNVGSDPILPDDTTEKDLYLNLRAQAYWIVREEIDKLDLPNDDELYEIANIKYKINSRGLIQIESKDDMKKRGVQSPDKADALMLSYVPHQPKPGFYL